MAEGASGMFCCCARANPAASNPTPIHRATPGFIILAFRWEPTTSRFSSVAFRNICNLQLSAFQGLRAFQFFFIVFSEFLKDFP